MQAELASSLSFPLTRLLLYKLEITTIDSEKVGNIKLDKYQIAILITCII